MLYIRNVAQAHNWMAEQDDELPLHPGMQGLDQTMFPIRMRDGRWRNPLPIIVPRPWNQDESEAQAAEDRCDAFHMGEGDVENLTINGVRVNEDDLDALGDDGLKSYESSCAYVETHSDPQNIVGVRKAVLCGANSRTSRIGR